MGKGTIVLPSGRCATESEALSALAMEARRRRTSYGMLVAHTSIQERREIVRNNCADKHKKGRRSRK